MRRFLRFLLLCLLPLTAHGALTVTDRGTGTNNTSQSATVMSPTSTIAVGSTGILQIAADNANGNTSNVPTNITDSVGNTWHLFTNSANNSANTGAEIAFYVCTALATQLTSSDSVTVTYSAANVTAKCWTFTEIAPAAGNVALYTGGSGITGGGNAQTSGSIASTSFLSIGNVIVAGCAAESADTFTPDSDTTNGTWSTHQHTAAGTGATGMSITTQYKVQTTTGSVQTYDVTLTSADTRLSLMTFKEVASATRVVRSLPNAGATTWAILIDKPLAAGSIGILCLATANAGSGGATKICPDTITDSASNTWTLRLSAIYDPAGVGAGAELAIYTAPITTLLSTSSSMTITWDAGVSTQIHNAALYEFIPDSGKSFAYVTSGSGTAANSATPTVTTASATSGDIVIGVVSAEEGPETFVADGDSTNGSWTQMQTTVTGVSGGTDQSLSSQYKVTTGTGTQTYNPTLTAADVVIGYASIRQSSSASATNGFFQW